MCSVCDEYDKWIEWAKTHVCEDREDGTPTFDALVEFLTKEREQTLDAIVAANEAD